MLTRTPPHTRARTHTRTHSGSERMSAARLKHPGLRLRASRATGGSGLRLGMAGKMMRAHQPRTCSPSEGTHALPPCCCRSSGAQIRNSRLSLSFGFAPLFGCTAYYSRIIFHAGISYVAVPQNDATSDASPKMRPCVLKGTQRKEAVSLPRLGEVVLDLPTHIAHNRALACVLIH